MATVRRGPARLAYATYSQSTSKTSVGVLDSRSAVGELPPVVDAAVNELPAVAVVFSLTEAVGTAVAVLRLLLTLWLAALKVSTI